MKLRFPDPEVLLSCRSSTNAEDGEEFNGAGLYDSKSGRPADDFRPAGSCPHPTYKPLSLALKKVWASTYNLNAFLARERFGIPHDLPCPAFFHLDILSPAEFR